MAGRSVWVCGGLLFVGSLAGCFDDDEPAADVSVLLEDEGSPTPDIVEPEPDLSSGPEDVLVVSDEGSPTPDIVEPEPDLSSGPEDVLVVEDEGGPAEDIVEPEPDLSSGPEDVLVVLDEGSEPECVSDVDCVTPQGCNEPRICDPTGTCVVGPFYAIIVASSVTEQPLQSGDLVINGVNIGSSLAEDDPGSYSGNDVSAIAKAAAINKWSDLTGVTALVTLNESNFWDGAAVAAGMLLPGDLNVNGVEVPATIFLDSDADSSLRDALNSLSSETGVFASVNMAGGLVLTEVQRHNIEISGVNPSIGGAIGLSPGIYTGGIELSSTWSEGISISGVNPSVIGMTAGITVPNTFMAVPCVDGVACTADSCDPGTGTCLHEFMEFTIGCGIP